MAEVIEKDVYKNRWLILAVVVMQPFMACLDGSIVNVALPFMAKKLNVSMASIEWVVTSYLIIISGTILIFGRVGDIKGKTTVFKYGLIIFTFGSFKSNTGNRCCNDHGYKSRDNNTSFPRK